MIDFLGLLMSEEWMEDRFSIYDTIRNEGRILWIGEGAGRWMVTGHKAAQEMLKNYEVFSSDRSLWEGFQSDTTEKVRGPMFTTDPPEHSHMRIPAQHVISPRTVARYRAMAERHTDELLNELADRDEVDLVSDFADYLPLRVLAEMVGVPPGDREFTRLFNKRAVANLDVVTHGINDQSEEFKQAQENVKRIFDAIIAERRKKPEDDLISRLLAAETPSDPLTAEEVRGLCHTIFIGGLEPGEFLICSAMNALFKHPDQKERLLSEPGLLGPGGTGGPAIEEFLRYDSPIHLIGRVVREDIEMEGQEMRKGQLVALNLGAANRDPEVFDQPHELDLGRSPNPHLALGHGIHRCLGSPVARMLGSVVIPALLTRFPNIRPAGDFMREHSPHVQHYKSAPVALK